MIARREIYWASFGIAGLLAMTVLGARVLEPSPARPAVVEHLLMHYHLAQHLCQSPNYVERRDHWCRKVVQKRDELAVAGYRVEGK